MEIGLLPLITNVQTVQQPPYANSPIHYDVTPLICCNITFVLSNDSRCSSAVLISKQMFSGYKHSMADLHLFTDSNLVSEFNAAFTDWKQFPADSRPASRD
jgi:hypothetical protein